MPFEFADVASDYALVMFAREGIPPGDFMRLTVRQRWSIQGILTGERKGFKHKRGDFS